MGRSCRQLSIGSKLLHVLARRRTDAAIAVTAQRLGHAFFSPKSMSVGRIGSYSTQRRGGTETQR